MDSSGEAQDSVLERLDLEDVWLSGPQLCRRLSVHPETVRRWRRQGLPSIGSGKRLRYPFRGTLQWLEQMGRPRG